jgi:hypothetical protein
VFNQKNEFKSAFICPYKSDSPFTIGSGVYFKDDVDTEFPELIDTSKVAVWDKDFVAKVKEKTYGPTQTSFQDNRSWGHGYDTRWDEYDNWQRGEDGIWSQKQKDESVHDYASSKWEAIKEIRDCMSQGWEDTDIMGYMPDEIHLYNIDLKDVRNQFIREDAKKMGYAGFQYD